MHTKNGTTPAPGVPDCFYGTVGAPNVFNATSASNAIALTAATIEARVDSRLLAARLGIQHRNLFAQVKSHKADFKEFGKVPFQTEALPSGQSEKFALLNEDQAHLLLTYSRNTAKVRALKVQLVKAFAQVRRTADMRRTEYLPTYHHLREAIHTAAAGSANERHVHVNVAKLVNKTAGIDAGQRAAAPVPKLALLVVAQLMVAKAMQSARDHHDGYQRAKADLLALSGITMLEGSHESS